MIELPSTNGPPLVLGDRDHELRVSRLSESMYYKLLRRIDGTEILCLQIFDNGYCCDFIREQQRYDAEKRKRDV